MDTKKTWKAVKTTVMEQMDPGVPSELGTPPVRYVVIGVVAAGLCSILARAWSWYSLNSAAAAPLGTFIGAAFVAWAALAQAKTSRLRHEEQTKADLQRRITENFSKAVEQLGSDKLAVRLGGIYTLERISLESWKDYWPIMETLSAFVRERSRETIKEEKMIATDVAAVMTVLSRRSDEAKEYERENSHCFDLSNADLRSARLTGLTLMVARLSDIDIQGATIAECKFFLCNFERANFSRARIFETDLASANFENANLSGVLGNKIDLSCARLDSAAFRGAYIAGTFKFARVPNTNFKGADLSLSTDLPSLRLAKGDEETRLPGGCIKPLSWLAPDEQDEEPPT
jgi:uncharacterized protein YjbI with pentapeptide repeats